MDDGSLAIESELALVRLALDLGALETGGSLSGAERDLAARASAIGPCDPLAVDDVRKRILAGDDPLGDVLCSLRSPLSRRASGAFYTPPLIVEPMIAWALAAKPTRLVDPGCGSGRFAASAIRHNPAISVVALDLDPLATLLARATFAALNARDPLVLCADYLTADIPEHDGVTAWVGNPPYIRHHSLTPMTKAWAARAADCVGHKVSGLAGLHALFFLATALRGKRGDVGCFVTSAEWLDVGYGSIVRHLFTNGIGGRALDLVDPRTVPFEDAMTTALVACFEIGREPGDIAVRLVDQASELSELEDGILVPAAEMTRLRRWSQLFRATREAHDGQVLGDIARVHRGIVTGSNEFFVMSRDEARQRGLSDWVRPAITRAKEILSADGVIHDSPDLRVVLDLPIGFDRTAHAAVDAYLATGERDGVDQRYITVHRRRWWSIEVRSPAPIVASYMARQAPKFARNPDGLALLNIGHGIFPTRAMPKGQLKALCDALNGARDRFAGSGRTYHGGLEKFEPREMEALPLPEFG